MQFYTEPEKKIPIKEQVDVLVVGSGPAGFSAAINAGRMGAKTMLIEQQGTVGGIATSGLMSHWTGETKGGFYSEILERAKDGNANPIVINPEKLKRVIFEMLEEAKVQVLLYTFASDVIMEGNHLKGVIVESKSGREAILAKVIIDASGDGDVAAKAGVPYHKGREEDGKMQPMTLMFKVAGVDYGPDIFPGAFEDETMVPGGLLQELGRRYLEPPTGHVLLYRTSLPGVVTVNMTNCIDLDGTRAEDLTKAEQQCRKQMDAIVEFLRKHAPGYENCYIISSASLMGVRETRHFQGEYTLTEEDINQARVFNDWVVTKAHFNFDIHNMTGSGLDETGVQKYFRQNRGYTIPYGCFVPKKVEDLLLAGRNISGTHMAHSNYRVMPICANMGQSMGIAAALCAKEDVIPRKLQIGLLQEKLMEQGVTCD